MKKDNLLTRKKNKIKDFNSRPLCLVFQHGSKIHELKHIFGSPKRRKMHETEKTLKILVEIIP